MSDARRQQLRLERRRRKRKARLERRSETKHAEIATDFVAGLVPVTSSVALGLPPVSQALGEIALPYLDDIGEDAPLERYQRVVTAAMLAWNRAVLFEAGEPLDDAPFAAKLGAAWESFHDALTVMTERKLARYAGDLRVVSEARVRDAPGEFRIQTVATVLRTIEPAADADGLLRVVSASGRTVFRVVHGPHCRTSAAAALLRFAGPELHTLGDDPLQQDVQDTLLWAALAYNKALAPEAEVEDMIALAGEQLGGEVADDLRRMIARRRAIGVASEEMGPLRVELAADGAFALHMD